MTAHLATWLAVAAAFVLLVAPIYVMFHFLVRLVRQHYGFDPCAGGEPPLRICGECDNTVMEADYIVCPYCGAALPPAPAGPGA